jgi:DNA repair protein RecO (recombination protein O)
MYKIYETKGYVLSSIPSGEADRLLNVFTKELGLVRAKAQGIRYEKSKLRFSTQDFSEVNISLVRGKGYWRLVNASSESNLFQEIKDRNKLEVVLRIFSLLERLIQGEEKNDDLFNILDSAISYLSNTDIKKEDLLDVECVIVLRILNNLGYVGNNKNLSFFTLGSDMHDDVAKEMKTERKHALTEINRALKESQL